MASTAVGIYIHMSAEPGGCGIRTRDCAKRRGCGFASGRAQPCGLHINRQQAGCRAAAARMLLVDKAVGSGVRDGPKPMRTRFIFFWHICAILTR